MSISIMEFPLLQIFYSLLSEWLLTVLSYSSLCLSSSSKIKTPLIESLACRTTRTLLVTAIISFGFWIKPVYPRIITTFHDLKEVWITVGSSILQHDCKTVNKSFCSSESSFDINFGMFKSSIKIMCT